LQLAGGVDAIPQIVVIGSSAGGIDALSTIVSMLPADMPAPVLVAQHLSPNRPSHLAEILQRQTKLAVESVDGPAELRNGTIYVLPAGNGAQFTDHEIRLVERERRGPTPSIDHLFASAAGVFGEGLVAVILTGTGSDGAVGAREVKLAGGTVVVQNPETASYPGMPNALAPTAVDIVPSWRRSGRCSTSWSPAPTSRAGRTMSASWASSSTSFASGAGSTSAPTSGPRSFAACSAGWPRLGPRSCAATSSTSTPIPRNTSGWQAASSSR